MLRKIKYPPVLLSIITGVLLAAALNNGRLWIIAWFAFIPLFLSLINKNSRQAFKLFYVSGLTFWSCTIYWLVNVTPLGTIILISYLALYFAVFGLIIRPFTRRSKPFIILLVPSVWVILEYTRSHFITGFPWALLGYSQYLNLVVIQLADIFGVWGVSFLIMFVNTALTEIVWAAKEKNYLRLKLIILALVVVLSSVLSYGCARLFSPKALTKTKGSLKVSLVQGNVPQELKWNLKAREPIIRRYFELTSKAVGDNPDLIVWPEAALPVVLEEEPEYYAKVRKYLESINKPLLFGSVTMREGYYYNSALLLSGSAELLNWYDKLHLVPFGEYVPLRRFMGFLDTIAPIGDISRGRNYTIFKLPASPIGFGVLICFEDVFPELARNFVNNGAEIIFNITNDAWFGKTKEAYQHLAASVFRAVENRVYLARCANTGVSAFISPSGEIYKMLSDANGGNIFVSGYCTDLLSVLDNKPTFYTLYGDILPFACGIFFICVIIFKIRKQK